MDLERYHVRSYDKNTYFEFFSEGANGSIKKIVEYTKIEKGLFNLSFGDWDEEHGRLTDTPRSNNGDRDKVLVTVAKTAPFFFNTYPDAYIYIEGGTLAKTRLYQMNINKYWHEINGNYIVFANYNDVWELFQHGKNYKAFAIGKR